ncbi:MAG: outer membrane beta-barrel protein [Pirellulales bacterium]
MEAPAYMVPDGPVVGPWNEYEPVPDYGDDGGYGPSEEWEGAGGFWDSPLRLHHSSIDGRSVGRGQPLRGTSWLNRPFEVGVDFGALVTTKAFAPNSRRNNDILGALHLGWDWDHYWGSQFRFAWSTPDLATGVGNVIPSNNFYIYDLSLMYYPWGDSRVRPYYRAGFGLTNVNLINDLGSKQNESLFTIPFGVGVKYQIHRTMVFRGEIVDNLAFGQNDVGTLNNFTLTFGVEWRFGGQPPTYWGWRPY